MMATRDEIKGIVMYLSRAFPNYHPELSGEINAVDVMFDLLGDIPADALRMAVRVACLKSGREFAPSAGAIREAVVELQMKADDTPTAEEAWTVVLKAINGGGGWNVICGEHPLIEDAVDAMGGLRTIESSDNPTADRAQYLRIYGNLLQRARDDAGMLPAVREYVEQKRLTGGGVLPQLEGGEK